MDRLEIILSSLNFPMFWLKIFLSFLFSFLITFFTIPSILNISRRKNLMDEPGSRSSHLRKISNLGGIAIVFSLCVCSSIFASELFEEYKFLFASLIILLYIGVTDDIMIMRAYKKLLAQILVSGLMVIGSNVRIGSLFGVFGIYEMSYYVSVVFSIFTFVILINAFNLIDGIDGLAGSYSVFCSIFFGISYFRLGPYNYPLVILSVVIVGSVLAFLYYNLSNYRQKKIFMGDTGSMILGFLLAFTGICFINIFIDKRIETIPRYHLESAPVIAVAILILPIIDTLNVIIIRLINKKSLLEADTNHVHHKLLRLGYTHRRSTTYIVLYYFGVVLFAYFFRHLNNNLLLFLIVSLGFMGVLIPEIKLKLRKSK